MAGKNTSVYGIYASRERAENAVDRLLASGFRNEDISVLLQDNMGTKDFAHKKETKTPEGTTAGVVTGGQSAERWVSWRASAHWRFPESARSSRRVPSWRPWPASDQAASWAALSAHLSAWAFPSTKPNATRVESRKEVFSSPSTATTVTG